MLEWQGPLPSRGHIHIIGMGTSLYGGHSINPRFYVPLGLCSPIVGSMFPQLYVPPVLGSMFPPALTVRVRVRVSFRVRVRVRFRVRVRVRGLV